MLSSSETMDGTNATHSAGAYIALAQLTDGGKAYRDRLDLVEQEGRLDYSVCEQAKEICKTEQLKPCDMTLTRLREELSKRGLYEPSQPQFALVIALEEAVRQESRILRLSQAATQTLIAPSKANYDKVSKVVSETKRKFRDKRVRRRAAKEQKAAEDMRSSVKHRSVFLSLSQLDEEWEAVPKDEVRDGIFVLNLDRKAIVGNATPLRNDIDTSYMTVRPELYEMLWRKEERGEVIWIRGKTYSYLSSKIAKLPVTPRDDDSLARKLNRIPIEQQWWTRTWQKKLPMHQAVFTNSESKMRTALRSNSFEQFVLAEFILQSNPSVLLIWGMQSLKARKRIRMRLKERLVGDLDYGNNQRDLDRANAAAAEAEEERRLLEEAKALSYSMRNCS